LFFVFVFFGAIQHYFSKFDIWVAMPLAVAGAVFTTLAATFGFVKAWYDVLKGPYELGKLRREEEVAERVKRLVVLSAFGVGDSE
jgi:hypothetical protein